MKDDYTKEPHREKLFAKTKIRDPIGLKTHCHDDSSDTSSLRERTFKAWTESPYISARKLCADWKIKYEIHGHTIRNYLSQFRCHYEDGRVLKPLVPHRRVFEWESVPRGLVEEERAVGCGWCVVSNRNGMLSFRSDRGSVHWFKGGLVRLFLKGSVQVARAKELFCRAFSWMSAEEFSRFLDGRLVEKERHWVFEVGSPMPRLDVRTFENSHGLRIFTDLSHPMSLEVAESAEPLYLAKLSGVCERFGQEIEAHMDLIKAWKDEAERARGGTFYKEFFDVVKSMFTEQEWNELMIQKIRGKDNRAK